MDNKTAWIQTYTGRKFFPFNPKPEDIDIRDIAHALSNICRFTGHTRFFYSVADHSRAVAELVVPEGEGQKLQALLHDASEAYLCDIARPIKNSAGMDFYKIVEAVLQRTIYTRFGVPLEEPEGLKRADARMCGKEALMLMSPLVEPGEWRWCTDLVDKTEPWITDTTPGHFLQDFERHGGRP